MALMAIAVVVVGYALGPAILSRRLAGVSSVGVMALSLSLCALVYAPIAAVQRPAVMPGAASAGEWKSATMARARSILACMG